MRRLLHLSLFITLVLTGCAAGRTDPDTSPSSTPPPGAGTTAVTTTTGPTEPTPAEGPSTTPSHDPPTPEWIPLAAGEIEGAETSDADLVTLASRYRILVAQNLSPTQRDRLRQLNPDIVLIKYQASVSAPRSLVADHPDWAVRDPSGDPVPSLNSTALVMVDPANPDLRRARTAQATVAVTEQGFDGIMFDEAVIVRRDFYHGFEGVDPSTGRVWTMDDFRTAQLENVRDIRAAAPDAFIVCNSVGNGTRYFDQVDWAHRFAEVCDALVAENYRGGSGDPAYVAAESEWVDNVAMGYDIDDSGASLNAYVEIVTDDPGDEDQRVHDDLFQYATFLLGYRDGALFSNSVQATSPSEVGGNVNTLVFRDFQTIDPGSPSTDRYEFIEGLYLRRFTNMVVAVNPTGDTIAVPLTEEFTDWRGKRLDPTTGLVLGPHSGTLLLPSG